MRRILQFVASIVLTLSFSQTILLTGQAQTKRDQYKPVPQGTADQLLETSRSAGIKVHREEVFLISRGEETFVAAPIAGWEQIPATELRKGVNFAYAYVSMNEPRVPKGYYTLKAYADVTGLGTIAAKVQLIDRNGRVAAEIPAEAEVHSLTVPREAASMRSFVTTTVDSRQVNDAGALRAVNQSRVWFRCPNGTCIRMPVLSVRNIPVFTH